MAETTREVEGAVAWEGRRCERCGCDDIDAGISRHEDWGPRCNVCGWSYSEKITRGKYGDELRELWNTRPIEDELNGIIETLTTQRDDLLAACKEELAALTVEDFTDDELRDDDMFTSLADRSRAERALRLRAIIRSATGEATL